ncbi:MAG: nuclear transport factor 2 family protein [Bacteroidota bacterium]
MRLTVLLAFLCLSIISHSQESSNKDAIINTLNNYIDGFYKGDSLKLKAALKPRLYKFGYWKNKDTKAYEYYKKMSYNEAIAFSKNVLKENRVKGEDVIRKAEVLDISNHIAAAKVTAFWGVDYMLLSKENGKWMIEQVIWEGPLEDSHTH